MKSQESSEKNKDASHQDPTSAYVASTLQGFPSAGDKASVSYPDGTSPGQEIYLPKAAANGHTTESDFSWEMIGLGLDEPLPPQDVMDDL